jgi:RsiW-degrading membrane proteinase PrsW (M82 family)
MTLWQQMIAFFKSFFIYHNVKPELMLLGIALAIGFGLVWLCAHWPPLFKKPWLFVVMVVSAFLTLAAITFVQIPLQTWTGQALMHFFSQQTLISWLLLAGIPSILISGLVQEGAKMVPMVVWWWRSRRNISPILGLGIGAIAGAGFGIFEAVWAHNQIFAAGWTVQAISHDGFLGIAGFWERFFVIGLHIAVSSLAGYGLAKGKGWLYYLIAAGLHSLINYAAVVRQYVIIRSGSDILVQVEVGVALVAIFATAWALLLRWTQKEEPENPEPTGADITNPPPAELSGTEGTPLPPTEPGGTEATPPPPASPGA